MKYLGHTKKCLPLVSMQSKFSWVSCILSGNLRPVQTVENANIFKINSAVPGWLSRLSIRLLISAQVMISRFLRSSPVLGSVLTAWSLLRIFSLPLSLSLLLSHSHTHTHTLSLCLSHPLTINKHLKKARKVKILTKHN